MHSAHFFEPDPKSVGDQFGRETADHRRPFDIVADLVWAQPISGPCCVSASVWCEGGSVRLHPGFPFPATCPERSGDSPGWAGDLGPADWGRSRAREESIEGGSFEEERREGSSFDGENIEGCGFQESRLETSSLEGYSFEGGSFEGGSLGRWV